MSSLKIDMLISQFLHLILERCDITLEWLWSTPEVRHCAHNTGSFNGSSYSPLIPITEEASISAFNVAINGEKLSQQFNVAPVNIILLNLSQVLLSFLISI